MFHFLEFLRVVAIGITALGLFGGIFYKSIFSLPFATFLMISTLFGLLVQPFLRVYHPYRKEVKGVIKHVESYIREVFPTGKKQEAGSGDSNLENALARAIYEFLYRTVDYSPFFTSRVNEQIRFFYFYYFVGLSLKISIPSALLALLLKGLCEQVRFDLGVLRTFIQEEFLLGTENVLFTILAVGIFAFIAYLLSARFNSTAKGIIMTELYARHVFLVREKKTIQELAKLAREDNTLVDLFRQKMDKEKGTLAKRKKA